MKIDGSDYGLLIESHPEAILLDNFKNAGNENAMPVVVFGGPKGPQSSQAVWTLQEGREFKAALWAVSNLLGADWPRRVILSVIKERHWKDDKKHLGGCKVGMGKWEGELRFAAQITLLPIGKERDWAQGNAGKGTFLGTCIHEIGHVVWFCTDSALQEKWNEHCSVFEKLPPISHYADKSYGKTGQRVEAFCECLVAMFLSLRPNTYLEARIAELSSILAQLKENGLRKK